MKKIVPFLAGLMMTVTLAACSPPPPHTPLTLEMRLAQDTASADTEPMREVTHNQETYYTNVVNVEKRVLLDRTAVKSAAVIENQWGSAIEIQFTAAGTQKFAEITRDHLHQKLAIIIDGQICEAPIIQNQITGGKADIAGNFSPREARDIVGQLNALANKD